MSTKFVSEIRMVPLMFTHILDTELQNIESVVLVTVRKCELETCGVTDNFCIRIVLDSYWVMSQPQYPFKGGDFVDLQVGCKSLIENG